MIQTAHFKNLKALADVNVSLSPLTVLVGANGAGKSTALDGIHAATRVVSGHKNAHPIGDVFRGKWAPKRVRTNGADGKLEVGLSVDGDDASRFRLDLIVDANEQPSHAVRFTHQGKVEEATQAGPIKLALGHPLVRPLGSCVRLRLDAAAVARESYSLDEQPRLGYDGAGLPTVIAWLAGNEPDASAAILERFRQVIPRARRFRTPRTTMWIDEPISITIDGKPVDGERKRQVPADRLEVELEGAGFVPADLLSEGTLLVLALVTALCAPERPGLVLLDDVDRGLHPRAQRSLVEVIQAMGASTQIVASTHSPFVVDCVPAASVRVLRHDAQGRVVCRALTDHPDWARWEGTMAAGEFWSWAGDEWVFGED